MFLNRATLIGYLGNDAEVRTGKNDQKFTTFSLATKTSYKDKESGEYVSHTEWHRCQGNRISKHLQKLVEEVVIPACTLELSAQGTF
jgi:hypothetical protein